MLWQPAIISHNSWFWGDYLSHKPFYKNWQLGKRCKKIRWYLEVLSLIFYQSVMEFLASKKCWRGNLRLNYRSWAKNLRPEQADSQKGLTILRLQTPFVFLFFSLTNIQCISSLFCLTYLFTSSLYQDSSLFNLKYFTTFGIPVLDPELCSQMNKRLLCSADQLLRI